MGRLLRQTVSSYYARGRSRPPPIQRNRKSPGHRQNPHHVQRRRRLFPQQPRQTEHSSDGSRQQGAPEHRFAAIQPHPTAEQLFAGAWSACYSAAVAIVAKEKKVELPANTAVDIEVDLGMAGNEYLLQARLTLVVPGLAQDVADTIAHAADQICPYSKATRGNIDVQLTAITA